MDDQAALARLCKRHDVAVKSDAAFQRQFRLLQALWREAHELPGGAHRDKPMGSLLAMPFAKESLANFLTETIQDVVRLAVVDDDRDEPRLVLPRLYDNLLSSQPLSFNLFGELASDTDLATAVLQPLWPDRIGAVTAIDFAWSPVGDELGEDTRFDVVVLHTTPDGGNGFIGMKVKYSENMRVGPMVTEPRHEAVARESGVFGDPWAEELESPPLQQIWHDHLLALSMLAGSDYDSGLFVVVAPADNVNCEQVALDYGGLLVDDETYAYVLIEDLLEAISSVTDEPWVAAFADRYLDSAKVDRLLDLG